MDSEADLIAERRRPGSGVPDTACLPTQAAKIFMTHDKLEFSGNETASLFLHHKKRSLLSSTLQLWWMLSIIFEQVQSQRLITSSFISRNVGIGLPTSFIGDVADISAFRRTLGSDPNPLFVYTAESQVVCPSGVGTKFLRLDGTTAGDAPCGNGATVSATTLKTDLTFAVFYNEPDIENQANSIFYQLQYSGGTYSVDQQKKMEPTVGNIGAAIGEDGTDYVYYFTDDNVSGRYNQIIASGPSGQIVHDLGSVSCPSPKSIYFHPTQTNTIVHYGLCGTPQIMLVDKSTLSAANTLYSPGGTGEGAYSHTLDNLSPTIMYVGGAYRAYWYSVVPSASEWVLLGTMFDAGAGSAIVVSNFVNFGTNLFLGFFVRAGSYPFNIYYKGNYSMVPATDYPVVNSLSTYMSYSLLGPAKMPNSERFVVAFMSSSGFNMQTVYFDIDLCTARAGGICTACPTGYYISQPATAGNWCYKEGFGVNPAIVAPAVATDLGGCSDTICADCASTATCTRCKRMTPQPLIYMNQCMYPPPPIYGRGATEYWESCTVQYCVRCTEDKTYCDSCDPDSGTTARLGKCVGPLTVPIGMGADWATGFAAPCNTTNCLDCFLDNRYCLKCDKSKEYYLEGTWCKYFADIHDYKGGDPDSGLVVKCLDRGCVDCKKNYTLCKKCDVPLTYYLDDWYCVLYVDIPYGKGVDAATGTLKKCKGPFCRDCFADYQVCMACDFTTGYYRHNKTCISFDKLEDGVGANLATGIVEPCTAIGCVVCQANYQDCTTCNAKDGYTTFNGGCTFNYDPSITTFGFWDPTAKVVKVSFNVEPVYYPSFEEIFKDISVFDEKTGLYFNSSQLNGQVTKTQLGFTIKFETNVTILSGVLTLPKSDQYRVLDKVSRLVFDSYPIRVTGVYLMPPTASTEGASSTLDSASQSRSLLTMAIFSFNPMVAVALDYMFNELFVLKLYEGPFMAYPELILKTSAESGILPFEMANLFESGISEGECVPSESFQTNDMNCVFLDNYGGDIQSLMMLLGVGIFFTVTAALFRLCLAPKPGEKKGAFLSVVEFINLNYGLQLFHAKMEGEKLEVMLNVMLGMKHRDQSFKYPVNIAFIILLQAYYWTISIVAVSFAAEVGRFLTRSPIILTLLRQHKKEKIAKDPKLNHAETRIPRFELIRDEPKPELPQDQDPWAIPVESVISQHQSIYEPVRGVTGLEEPVQQEDVFGSVRSNAPSYHTVPAEMSNLSANGRNNPAIYMKNPVSQNNSEYGDIDWSVPQEHTDEKRSLAARYLQASKTSFAPESMLQQPRKLDAVPASVSVKQPSRPVPGSIGFRQLLNQGTNQDLPKKNHQLGQLGRFLRKKSKALEMAIRNRTTTGMIPADFRPEAKEYIPLEQHQFRQISFFVAENTITRNTLYRFAPLVGFWRACLLSIIVTKVVGQPVTQVTCGLSVEVLYLVYLMKSKYKSSLLEHWVDVVLQMLQVAYLSLKLLSIFSILTDEVKQDYLGLPMAGTLGLIAVINVLFVLYNMVMIIWELLELAWVKLRAKFRKQ